MLLIGWAAYRLAKLESPISADRQQSRELADLFKECKELFEESLENPELARRESDLVWYEALLLKAEYLGVADRLESDLPELDSALNDASTAKGRAELPRKIHELNNWIKKQKDRADMGRLAVRSKELKERIAGAQRSRTNGPIALTQDLESLLKETDQTYEGYLSDFKEVTNNTGKPLVEAFVAQHRDLAKRAIARLSELGQQARRDAKAIDLFLETQSHSDTVKRTRRQKELIQAFLDAGSPAEFIGRIHPTVGAPYSSASKTPALRAVRYALLAALTGLGVFLIVDLYRGAVVMPLRIKLVQRDGIIVHQKKLAHFEQLAAGLAHEIRNPLTTINARLYTVQRKLPEGTPEHKDAVVIGTEIERVNQILKEFIQLTRPTPPTLARMTAEPLLQDVRDLLMPQLQWQAIRLVRQSHGQAEFDGDQQQLKQVLINLVQNAAESIGRDGTIILRARDGRVPFNGIQTKVAIIEVEDDGPGIRPEVQGRLFDPFFSTKKEGTGLGLPISARIIDRHGGALDFETQVGRGTIFRIVLPAHEKR